MDCFITVNCRACDCSFELTASRYSDRENLVCPNCAQRFPKEDFEKLRLALTALNTLPERVGADPGPVDAHRGFSLSLELDKVLPF